MRDACRSGLIMTLLLGFTTSLGTQSSAQIPTPSPDVAAKANQANDVVTLAADKTVEREIKGGEKHTYQIALAANQFFDVLVEQRGVDVVVRLIGQQGEMLREVDSPNGTEGPEPISWVTEAAGVYRLEVSPLEQGAKAGRYGMKVVELRAAMPQDKDVISAERAFAEGDQLRLTQKPEPLRSAIAKFDEALRLWQGLGNRPKQALTLHALGFVYDLLGEQQKALEFYNQALQMHRATSDRGGEAVTLNNIGLVYSSLGDKQKALEFYHQALTLFKATENQRAQAQTLNRIGVIYDDLGDKQKALEFYTQALPLQHVAGDRNGEVTILNNIARVYISKGDKEKALEFYNQALALSRTSGDKRIEAQTLNETGALYDSMGQTQKALELYKQALPLLHDTGDRSSKAITLTKMGAAYM
ncbi:MAG: tetratricopeptide repeat protein, partial [Pyrinomonadaceae bacterium]